MYPDLAFMLNGPGNLATPAPKQHKTGFPIPQELLDGIIDCLADDKRSLLACALTARAWRPRSQAHLHRTLRVTSKMDCKRAEALYCSPFLASCIRELCVEDLGVINHWVDQDVPAMLSRLNQVYPLAIDSLVIGRNRQAIKWGDLPGPLFPNVTKLFVKRLHFHVGSEFAAFIRHFPRLSSLTLRDFGVEYHPRDMAAPGPRPRLRNLEIYNSEGQEFFMTWFLHQPPGDIRLETFVYSIERWHLRAPQLSLKALGASVKNLTIIFAFESPHYLLREDPILPHLSSVHSLTFDHATLYGTLYGPPSIPVLLQALSASRITTIRFCFTLDKYPGSLEQSVEKLSRIKLAQTDGILHALQSFSGLQDVLIQIRSDEWARLTKLHSADEWVQADIEQKRIPTVTEKFYAPLRPADLSTTLAQMQTHDWQGDGSAREAAQNMELNSIKRSQAEYEKAVETWHNVNNVFQKAFPAMAARKLLRVEPLEDGSSERASPSSPRYYHMYHHERLHHHIGYGYNPFM